MSSVFVDDSSEFLSDTMDQHKELFFIITATLRYRNLILTWIAKFYEERLVENDYGGTVK